MNQPNVKPEHLPKTPVLKPVLFSLLILISGVIIGAGTTLIITNHSKRMHGGPEWMSRRTIEYITRELELPPAQKEQLDPIVNQHMKAIEKIRDEIARPKIMAELEQMNEEIMAILDEQQKQVWEEKVEQMRKRFEEMRRRGGGRRDGTGPHGPGRGGRGPGGGRRHEGPPPEGTMPPGEMPLPPKEPPAEDAPPPQDTPPAA